MEVSATRLRPMSFTDIVDTAVSLYRQNFVLFAGVAAVLAVPEAIINTLITATSGGANPITTTNGSSSIHFNSAYPAATSGTAVIGYIFGIVITGALARVISARYLGARITVGEAYTSVGLGRFILLFLASILEGIVAVVPVIVAILLFVLTIVLHAAVGVAVLAGIVLFPAALISLIYILLHLEFVSQAIVIERLGVIQGFKRSWQLVSGSFWRVFGIVLLITIIIGMVQLIVGGVITGLLAVINRPAAVLISGLINVLFLPAQYGAFTLLYYDLRVRKEGFDLEHLASNIEDISPQT